MPKCWFLLHSKHLVNASIKNAKFGKTKKRVQGGFSIFKKAEMKKVHSKTSACKITCSSQLTLPAVRS